MDFAIVSFKIFYAFQIFDGSGIQWISPIAIQYHRNFCGDKATLSLTARLTFVFEHVDFEFESLEHGGIKSRTIGKREDNQRTIHCCFPTELEY
jgi:hypothetical protein